MQRRRQGRLSQVTQLENDSFTDALLIGGAITEAGLVLGWVWFVATRRRPPAWSSALQRASRPLQGAIITGAALMVWAMATAGSLLVAARATGHNPLRAPDTGRRLASIVIGLVLTYGTMLLVALTRSRRR